MFIRVLLSFSVQRCLILWFLLEINFLCFIGILSQLINLSNPNSNLYYFLVQSLGRVIILFRLLCNRVLSIPVFRICFFLALLLKLGGAPFQFWYLKLIQKLDWGLIWVLSVWQKLIPLILLSFSKLYLFRFFGGLRVFIGRITTWKQKNFKKIFGLSSVFSLGWLLVSLALNKRIWLLFIAGYGISLLVLIVALSKTNFISSDRKGSPIDAYRLILFITGLLMLRGIPPFIGFFLKVSILVFVIKIRLLIGIGLLLASLYLIFIYLRIIFYRITFLNPKLSLEIRQKKLILRELIVLNFFVVIFALGLLYCVIIHK